jgi:ubiquinone/menaquinone biosynthesis C-methylase UbiE
MAELGFDVVGIDSSPGMIDVAKRKASNAALDIAFAIGDASAPDAAFGQFDVVLGRHILWALPDPSLALANWTRHLLPGGHLVLIEGFWHTGTGLHQHEVEAALPPSLELIRAESLSGDPLLWGGPVTDERFVVTAKLRL